MSKQTKQSGFTLIELVVVIVILGILAATAVPKFVDLASEAKVAKANGVAGSIAASAGLRYAEDKVKSTGYTTTNACQGVYLTEGALPSGCTAILTSQSCAVTCEVAASAVTLP